MKELKNLIKIFTVAVALSLPYTTQAQILDMSVDLSPLQLTDDFLRSLYFCKPYHGEKASSYDKINVKTVYDISEMEDDKCQLKVEGFTNTSVHITQECNLTQQQAKEYADALSNYQANRFSPRFDEARINSNQHYQKAMGIMSDTKICNFYRDKIDNTAEIRENLLECNPIKSVENIMDSKVTREIVGQEEDKCHFRFMLWEPKPDISRVNPEMLKKIHAVKDIVYKYDCLWNEGLKQEYFNILDAFVIPEETGYDFSAINRPNSWEEMDFIIRNCKYEIGD